MARLLCPLKKQSHLQVPSRGPPGTPPLVLLDGSHVQEDLLGSGDLCCCSQLPSCWLPGEAQHPRCEMPLQGWPPAKPVTPWVAARRLVGAKGLFCRPRPAPQLATGDTGHCHGSTHSVQEGLAAAWNLLQQVLTPTASATGRPPTCPLGNAAGFLHVSPAKVTAPATSASLLQAWEPRAWGNRSGSRGQHCSPVPVLAGRSQSGVWWARRGRRERPPGGAAHTCAVDRNNQVGKGRACLPLTWLPLSFGSCNSHSPGWSSGL